MIVMRAENAVPYQPAGHFGFVSLKYHNKDELNGAMSLGLSKLEPGGYTDFSPRPVDMIYYVLEGQLTIRNDQETVVPGPNCSVRFEAGEKREVRNETDQPAAMLVIASFPH